MKLSEIEVILKTYIEHYGDMDINFNMVDYESNMYENCPIDIDYNPILNKVELTVFSNSDYEEEDE